MVSQITGLKRLEKLAGFLDELPPKLWDYGTIMDVGDNEPLKALKVGGGCGTVGCAIGWSPACFPKQLKWDDGSVTIIGSEEYGSFQAAGVFFGLRMDEVELLFDPNWTSKDHAPGWPKRYGKERLPYDVSPKQVATHIRKFVEIKRREA